MGSWNWFRSSVVYRFACRKSSWSNNSNNKATREISEKCWMQFTTEPYGHQMSVFEHGRFRKILVSRGVSLVIWLAISNSYDVDNFPCRESEIKIQAGILILQEKCYRFNITFIFRSICMYSRLDYWTAYLIQLKKLICVFMPYEKSTQAL